MLHAFEAYIVSEVAFHLRRCVPGVEEPELAAATLVHTMDAQLHRVLLDRDDRTEQLVRLALRLVGS
ncbi:MAG: hypothetical protein ACRDQ7_02745 [Haloechinothrix sp.]